jgi:hypothetical protein
MINVYGIIKDLIKLFIQTDQDQVAIVRFEHLLLLSSSAIAI